MNLYSPIEGTVIKAQNSNYVSAGKIIVIDTGTDKPYFPHLHYGIFLAEQDLTDEFSDYTPWVKNDSDKSTVNPLLFYNLSKASGESNTTENNLNFEYYINRP